MNAQDLKNSILQLAIQGKLVEQREEEGTAKELLENTEAEKKKKFMDIKEDERLFDIPGSWEWLRIGSICNVINGFTPSKSNPKFWNGGTIPWFTIADVRKQGRFINSTEQAITEHAISKNSERIIPKDSILLCCTASVGEYAYTNIPLTTNQQFNGLVIKDEYKTIVYPMYIYEFVKTLKRTLLLQAGKTTIDFVSVKKVSNIAVPIPPFEEQKRIVAKIEELLPYVDKYDAAYSEVEGLNKKFPDDMQKSILQYAIKGKLVKQRAEDGTAEELYKQIQDEKKKGIKEGKIKKSKALPEISEEEIPFDIPENWKWVRLGDLFNVSSGMTPAKTNPLFHENGEIPWITSAQTGNIKIEKANNFITKYAVENTSLKIYSKHTLLIAMYGQGKTRGQISELLLDATINQACAALENIIENDVFRAYILYFQMYNYDISRTGSEGSAQPNLNLDKIRNILVPMPPIEEQKRIVEKIEELLPYAKQLVK